MKVFLRILITVAVVIAIVLGVRALVGDSNRTEAYVFENLSWKTECSSAGINQNLNGFYEYKENNPDQFGAGGVYEELNTTLIEGQYVKIDGLYQKAEALFIELKNQSALAREVSKSAQNDVIDSYEDFLKAVENEKAACESLKKLFNATPVPNADDLTDVFGDVVSAYENALNSLVAVNDNLRIYVLKEVYSNKLTSFESIKTSLKVQMMNAYSQNKNLESDMNLLFDNLDLLDDVSKQELLISYSNIESIVEFLKAENKATYVANTNDNLKKVANLLFGIEA